MSIHCLEYIKAFGPSLIAIFVAYIAYQQWKTNKDTLREKLFDRRFLVFQETENFLSLSLVNNRIEYSEVSKFTNTCQNARFLFRTETYDRLMEIRAHSLDLAMHLEMIPETSGENRKKHIKEKYKELEWLDKQRKDNFNLFEKSLKFDIVRR